MTKLAIVAVLVACTSSSPAPTAEMPTKIYDFSSQRLDAPLVAAPVQGASVKTKLRFALQQVRPAIAACANGRAHPAGTIEIRLQMIVDGEHGAMVAADAEAFDAGRSACVESAVMAMPVPTIDVVEPELWTVNAPLDVDANYTASR